MGSLGVVIVASPSSVVFFLRRGCEKTFFLGRDFHLVSFIKKCYRRRAHS